METGCGKPFGTGFLVELPHEKTFHRHVCVTFMSDLSPGDLYLLRSDGLHAALRDDEILAIILSMPDRAPYKTGLSLVLKAPLAGGKDDTVTLIAFSE